MKQKTHHPLATLVCFDPFRFLWRFFANMRPNQIRRLNLVTMSLVDYSRHLPVTLVTPKPIPDVPRPFASTAACEALTQIDDLPSWHFAQNRPIAFPTWGLRGGLRRQWMNAFAAKCWSWAQVTKYQHQASIPARKVMALAQRQSKCLGEKSARKQPAP